MKIGTKILWLLMLTVSLGVISCKKTETPKARITVLNRLDENKPVEKALVTVYANAPEGKVDPYPDGDITRTGVTNSNGQIDFDFPVANILSVIAELPVSDGDTLFGTGVLRLADDETYEETVFLSQYKSQF